MIGDGNMKGYLLGGNSIGSDGGSDIGSSNGRSYGSGDVNLEVYPLG